MFRRTGMFLILALALVALAAACAPTTPAAAPTTGPSATPVVIRETVAVPMTVVVQQTVIPATAVPTAAPSATAMPTALAQVPADALTQKGKLTYCTDFPYPPQEFFDDQGNPQGLDIDIGNEIATRLALKSQYVNSVFDSIIAALKGGKCDVALSAMNVTGDRQKSISQIPYFRAGQSMVAVKGNPQNINQPSDLCGKAAAAESGTTEADYLQGTGDYDASKGGDGGLAAICKKAGKPQVNVQLPQKDSDAFQMLQANKVAVYFADSPVASYYVTQHPNDFQVVGQIVEPALEGLGVACGQDDCSKAPLTPLGQAVKTALLGMMNDGTYTKILTKWGVQAGALTPADVSK